MNDYITMLGTGNAHATRCYNTCFTLHCENLILYHTEDRTLDIREQRYKAEAETAFSGHVFVPDDLEKIML